MTQQEKLTRLESLHSQAVNLVDALMGITELSRDDDSVNNHTLTLLEWTVEKARDLSNNLDEVVMEMSREIRGSEADDTSDSQL